MMARQAALVLAIGLFASLNVVPADCLRANRNEPDDGMVADYDWGDDLDEERFTDLAVKPTLPSFEDEPGMERAKRKQSHNDARRALAQRLQRGQATEMDLMKYADRYNYEFKGRSMMYFLHVSRSAGTLMCECARTSCHVYPLELWNCAPEELMKDGFRWNVSAFTHDMAPRPASKRTCSAADSIYKKAGLDFVSNENTVLDDAVCQGWWNSMVFRNPINRLMSEASLLWCSGKIPAVEELRPEGMHPQKLFDVVPKGSDNYYVRSLAGQEVWDKPHGTINSTDLEVAKRRLKEFDSVFILGRTLNHQITQELGLPCPLGNVQSGCHTDQYANYLNSQWSQDMWDTLVRANSFDFELFEYAKALRRLDRQILLHSAFRRQTDRLYSEDSSGSCGKLSAYARR